MKPELQPENGLIGRNDRFAIEYDTSLVVPGLDPAVPGVAQAAPIISWLPLDVGATKWVDKTSFLVAGDLVGDTIIRIFPVFAGEVDRSVGPLLEIPVQVDLPMLSEPGLYQLEVSRRNLELRRSFSGEGNLEQHPTPIPPQGGGTNADWKLPDSATIVGGIHRSSTVTTDNLDAIFEFCMTMIAQIAPAYADGVGPWHEPVSGVDSFLHLQPTQAESNTGGFELALDQYRLLWNSGMACADAQVSERLRQAGAPLQQWLRAYRHYKANGEVAPRTDPQLVRQRMLLETKLKSYMDVAAVARLKRYFSLDRDYLANVMDG